MNAEAEIEKQRTKDATRIDVTAWDRVRRWCRLSEDEVPRLDGLALKLRSLDGDLVLKLRSLNGESAEEIRSGLMSTLLVNGLAFAEVTAGSLVIFSSYGVRRPYWLRSDYAKRVLRLAKSTWPHAKTRPYIEEINGALIRLALGTAETEESFKSEIASQMLTATNAQARRRSNRTSPTAVVSFQRAISSSLELSRTLNPEPAMWSTRVPSAATAPPRGSAASAAPSSAARSSPRPPSERRIPWRPRGTE